ncbi:hypothetical protein ED733_006495 [Metarhizium rileyi]|uniref:Uncharacterized protein n=1 Tax=Metarhizium rileyi (strain RCEF 4871) TaxID=1649241 RepID=A0A5C6GKV8_METRR|nr:hypothetical protein ED733_006495 [Metarhizium rileyi]
MPTPMAALLEKEPEFVLVSIPLEENPSSIAKSATATVAKVQTQPAFTVAGSAPTSSQTPPMLSFAGLDAGSGSAPGRTYIKTFRGTGIPAEGWPEMSQWIDFDAMWSSNLAGTIRESCTAFQQPKNSEQESSDIRAAIQSVGKASGVDERFILAVVLQESGGCVRAPTTSNGVINPGLMQSHNGAHTCYNVSPCPSATIAGMIQDGVTGTSSGHGYQNLLPMAGSGVSQYYKAARLYNSGSIAQSGLLEDGIATHCYVTDIANRLIGWSEGGSGCDIP